MGLFATAREIYLVAKDDATLEANVRSEHSSLASLLVTDGETAFELTSSTVNGQSFSGTRSMTKLQRLRMLGAVVKMLDSEVAVRTDGQARFSSHGDC